jgi:hypothetical protein
MSAGLNEAQEHSQSEIPRWLLPVRELVFGKQNERIEYFMDSYFKLPPEGRTAAIASGIALAIIIVLALVGVYISALNSLQKRLDESFWAVNTLRDKQIEFAVNKKKYDELEKRLANVTQSLQILSLLEEKAKSKGLQISGNNKSEKPSTEKDFVNSTLLKEQYKSMRTEFRISNVSLQKIIDLVVDIESDNKLLRVTDLRIKGLYQNKLYFDAMLAVDGVEIKR